MKKVLCALLIFLLIGQVVARGPGIVKASKPLDILLCDYQTQKKQIGSNLRDFIAIFENHFSTNDIKDEKLKEQIFCLLYDFYLKEDVNYAEDFKANMPQVECKE